MLITAFAEQLTGLLTADDSELSLLRRNLNIRAALERYSADRPFLLTDDVTGDAGRYYPIATALPEWSEGFSRVVAIEYPAHAITADAVPQYLEPEDWQDDYWAGDIRYLFLPHHAPVATDSLRIAYTIPWAWLPSTTIVSVTQPAHGFAVNDYVYLDTIWTKAIDPRLATHKVATITAAVAPAVSGAFTAAVLGVSIPTEHFFAVCYLAAAICCRALAAKYAAGIDNTIAADSVARLSNSSEFARRADEFTRLYEQGIGTGKDIAPPVATGRFVEWDTDPGWPGNRRWLYHNKRGRA